VVSASPEVAKQCSTCKEEPPRDGQRTCSKCHAAYMKDYARRHKGSRDTMQQRQWFQRGATALRGALMRHFTNIARGEFNGLTAAEIARQCPDPEFPRNGGVNV
jgi:hypothetical protein